jgi:histidinol-phosphate phosphatase family protein
MTAAADGPALLMDRDGTLIEDVGYPRDPDQVRLLPGAAEALAGLSRLGFRLVLVSNQSGIGRGLITAAEADRVHGRLVALLAESGVILSASCYCPHAPDEGCECRKPRPGLLLRAFRDLGLDASRSFMIGDKASDVEAGERAGCRTILLAGGRPATGEVRPDFLARDWPDLFRLLTQTDLTPQQAAPS